MLDYIRSGAIRSDYILVNKPSDHRKVCCFTFLMKMYLYFPYSCICSCEVIRFVLIVVVPFLWNWVAEYHIASACVFFFFFRFFFFPDQLLPRERDPPPPTHPIRLTSLLPMCMWWEDQPCFINICTYCICYLNPRMKSRGGRGLVMLQKATRQEERAMLECDREQRGKMQPSGER